MNEDRRRVAVALAVVIGLSALVVPAAGAPAGAGQAASVTGPAGGGVPPTTQAQTGADALFAQTQVDPDIVVMRADVRESGDAAWTVDLRVRLASENETAAFESVQDDVEANASAFTGQFGTGMNRTVRSAENATDREMALANLTVSATIEGTPQRYGVLTYRFTWENFAGVDGDRLRVGDALSGFFLDSESSLVLAWPDGYERTSVTPPPDQSSSDSVTWNGRTSFGPEEPRLVVSTGTSASGLPGTMLLAAVVAVAALLAGGWLVAGRLREDDSGEPLGDDAGGASAATDTAGGSGTDADGTGAAGEDTAESDDEATEPPEELLSNEERVIKLLEANGGRIKQQQIATEYDWTDAKTSQVVGSLRDEDAVETFRIGRENVVALPEESDL
jgi:hypothetical protein